MYVGESNRMSRNLMCFHPREFPTCVNHSKSELGLVLYSGRSDTSSRKSHSDKLYYQRVFSSGSVWIDSSNTWSSLLVRCRVAVFVY